MTPMLFTPYYLRELELPNRVVVAPMCQYQARDGLANEWHLAHLGQLAMGAGGLVIAEATGVSPDGRITPGCLGLWSDRHAAALEPVLAFCRRYGTARLGIQLGHAGRKASCAVPLDGGRPLPPDGGAWQTIGPSAVPYGDWHVPRAASEEDLDRIEADFVAATKRAAALGFDLVEIHMAHGYLLQEFLSPLSNRRNDQWGGDLKGRMRFPLRVFSAMRAAFPAERPLGVRVTAHEWVEGGWSVGDTIVLAGRLRELGCDFIDVSSGGNDPRQKLQISPGYQVPFAEAVRSAIGMPTMAVGLILDARQAEAILQGGEADLVALGRTAMDDPRWLWHAAQELGVKLTYPNQQIRARPDVWPGAAMKRQRHQEA